MAFKENEKEILFRSKTEFFVKEILETSDPTDIASKIKTVAALMRKFSTIISAQHPKNKLSSVKRLGICFIIIVQFEK